MNEPVGDGFEVLDGGYGDLEDETVGPGAAVAFVYFGRCSDGFEDLPAAVAYLSWAYVLAHIGASKAASYMYGVPPVTVVIGWVWLGEVPPWISIVGGLTALGGVVLVNWRTKPRPSRSIVPSPRSTPVRVSAQLFADVQPKANISAP